MNALCEDCAVGLDSDTRDLKAHWLEEDDLKGIAKGLNATIAIVQFVVHSLRGQRGNALTIACTCDGHYNTSMRLSLTTCSQCVTRATLGCPCTCPLRALGMSLVAITFDALCKYSILCIPLVMEC